MNNIHKCDYRFTCEIENTEKIDSTILATPNQESSIINSESSSTSSDPAIIFNPEPTTSQKQSAFSQQCQINVRILLYI